MTGAEKAFDGTAKNSTPPKNQKPSRIYFIGVFPKELSSPQNSTSRSPSLRSLCVCFCLRISSVSFYSTVQGVNTKHDSRVFPIGEEGIDHCSLLFRSQTCPLNLPRKIRTTGISTPALPASSLNRARHPDQIGGRARARR